MFMDYVLNGAAYGPVAEQMLECQFQPGLRRPFIDKKGRRCVTLNVGKDPKGDPAFKTFFAYEAERAGMPVLNATTTLRKDEWIDLDRQIIRVARARLRAWTDLSASSSFGGFNGMSKMILEHETMSDPGEAVVDMDAISEGRTDAPVYQLEGLPLPITHSDFWFSARRLAISRNSGTPLDTTMGEAAGRRVAEMVEKTLIGTLAGVQYGKAADYNRAPKVYGYTNFPARITKTDLNAPTGGGWEPMDTVQDFLEIRDLMYAANQYGPFMVYHSTDWDKYMDNDYAVAGGNNASQTLRQRLRAIEGVLDVRRLDFLPSATNPFTLLVVSMTPEVARAVNGMDLTTVQWESQGGMRVNFKVMAIMVPQLRADFNGQTGIVHATTS